ncbi:MAG TPA: hypothetical protein VNL77_19580 [Roseiflexaceae bacterium]|nr:hypothetical protein [Roseiflexaceae bacterium]
MVRNYRYQLLPPLAGADIVDRQLLLATRYAHTLVYLEHVRRFQVRRLYTAHGLRALEEQIAAIEQAIGERRRAIKTKASLDAARDREWIRGQLTALKALRAEHRERRRQLREDPAIREAFAAIDEAHHAALLAERARSGLYWGTYLLVEQAHEQRRRAPALRAPDTWTQLGVQVQHGMPVPELLEGEDSRLRLTPAEPVPGRRGRPCPRLWCRVQSDENRAPIWAVWPIVWYRPIPEDGRIMWVRIVRRMVGFHPRWEAVFTVRLPDVPARPTGDRALALDLHWCRTTDGRILAGTWATTDEPTNHPLVLPSAVRGRWDEADRLRSHRDQHMNELRETVSALLERDPPSPLLAERLKHYAQWRSPERWHSLWRWWLRHQPSELPALWQALDAWHKRDRHLGVWESATRRRGSLHRLDVYRAWAKQMAARYDVLVVEDYDLRRLREKPTPESEEPDIQVARRQHMLASPGELRLAVMAAFEAAGRQIVTVRGGPSAAEHLQAWREGLGAVKERAPDRAGRWQRRKALAAERAAASAGDGTAA